MTKLKLPIGIESFEDVATNCYYVDKTDMIRKISDYPKESVLLFTRPRRFGKSLTLSMIDTFFNMKIRDASRYFEKTRIYHDADIMKYISSYPVIHLDMKEVVGNDVNEMMALLSDQIAKSFHSFPELRTSEKLSDSDKLFVQNAMDKKLSKTGLILSLNTLTRLVYLHYSLCSIILIDEYDCPLQNAFDHDFYKDAADFFKPFYSSAMKGNGYLQFALLTGVMQVAKESMFSGLNNIIVNSVLDSSFDEYFGFSENEVRQLLETYDLGDYMPTVKDWYDGYHFGKEKIYNPWSLLCFIANQGEMKEYWKMTGENSLLKRILQNGDAEMESVLNSFINHERVISFIDFSMNYADQTLDKKTLLSTLVASGYLTADESLGMGLYSLKIPNKEIQSLFVNEVLDMLPSQSTMMNAILLKKAFSEGNLDAIQDIIEKLLLSAFSYYEFSSEKNYQILLLTLSSLLFEDAIVKSETIPGNGRSDIQILSKNNEFGFVLEVKAYQGNVSMARLEDYSQKALKQIVDKKYDEELKNRGTKKIILYGIAFSKKAVKISKKIIG